ncbi:MAG: CDP-alcohol phosphatidyltransferase family protein [Phycisphaerales bacterium]|nr:CDP-alcohol phosphatidyltransferase family protein [Phycisphaerales bacterium]
MDARAPSSNRPKWLPNALVWVRLALAALFVAMLSLDPLADPARLLIAAAIFILAALTDMLDGRLARAWDAVTRFGRVMDPFADKILVLGAFICLAGPAFAVHNHPELPRYQASGVYPWMAILILGRELLVTSLRGLVEGEGGDFSAIPIGKAKMVAQSVAIPLILLLLALADWDLHQPARWAIDLTAWATLLITLASGIPYVQRAFARKQGKPQESPSR